jgi:hypothetical protein
MSTGVTQGNTSGLYTVVVDITPAEVATIVTVEQTFTVTGVKVGDGVSVSPPGLTAGAAICSARVSAADTVAIGFVNPTVAGVTPLTGDHVFTIYRPENGVGASIVAD